MKSRPFFNGTAFRKDITRFAPLWVLYLIGGLMIAIPTISESLGYYNGLYSALQQLNGYIGYFGLINIVYAMVAAQLLFGDLYNSKLCNALHAMPIRRESWFLTHLGTGVLFSVVPNLIISLSMMPMLRSCWYVSLLWLLGMTLHYLFFFGLSVFSMHCTGNRFAAVITYLIFNFISLLAMYYYTNTYAPLLYGIDVNDEIFLLFCPVVSLCIDPNYFTVVHLEECPCKMGSPIDFRAYDHLLQWQGLGNGWIYLLILTALGLVFMVLALLLYRRRNLESAGDFIAFRPMKPVFGCLFALCAGGGIPFIGENILGMPAIVAAVFMILGLVCGFFVGQMLLERTIKVFKRRIFAQFAIFIAVFGLTVGLTAVDAFGVTRYIPKAEKIESVQIGGFSTTDPALIAQVRDIHQSMIEEGPSRRGGTRFAIVYTLRDGSKVSRTYCPTTGANACLSAWELMKEGETALFGADTLEALKEKVDYVKYDGRLFWMNKNGIALLEALWQDFTAGNLFQNQGYHNHLHGEKGSELTLVLCDGDGKSEYLYIYSCCTNTNAWMKDYKAPSTEEGSTLPAYFQEETPEALAKLTSSIETPWGCLMEKSEFPEIFRRLQLELKENPNTWSTHYQSGWDGIIFFVTDQEPVCLYLDPHNSSTLDYISTLYDVLK